MVDSRLNTKPESLFHCFVKVLVAEKKISYDYPDTFDDKEPLRQQIPVFCFPCAITSQGVQYSTFVLTDINSKFRFGFCRYPPKAVHCLCIVSYLPWFETFYAVLDKIASFPEKDCLNFLDLLNQKSLPNPGGTLVLKCNFNNISPQTYTINIPDTTKLPSIPENRNLTEYFAKVLPQNMVYIFISMLFERRIIVTSEKLSVLTAVVHGSVALLYPMQWQHIYVPILPPHLIDYCCAPMPFLLGIHSSMMPKVRQMPMNEVVILNADTNEIEIDSNDLTLFPSKVANQLKKKLQRTDKALSQYVSTQFLKALADLIGGYRDALKFVDTPNGGKIVFDNDMFLNSRYGNMKAFLTYILDLQSFRQFVAGRLDMLNDGVGFIDVFEQAILQRNQGNVTADVYGQWRDKVKKGGGVFKKTVEGKYGHLKGIVNDIEVKDVKKKIKTKVKDGYKGVMKLKDGRKTEERADYEASIKRNNSMPLAAKQKVTRTDRHSMYTTKTRRGVPHPGKTPPPRPPTLPPSDIVRRLSTKKEPASVDLLRKDYTKVETHCPESYSEPNIAALIDTSDSSSIESSSEDSLLKSSSSLGSSRTTSSKEGLEHDGSFFNPAFRSRFNDSDPFGEDPEVTEMEQPSLIPSPYQSHPTVRSTSLKRSSHVNPQRPKHPPPRPPPSIDKHKPARPPLPSLSDVTDDATNISVSSPFYSPVNDLLDFQGSLFQETMLSLSDETRSLVSSPLNDSLNHETLDASFKDTKTKPDDLFLDCLQTAKKDLQTKQTNESATTNAKYPELESPSGTLLHQDGHYVEI